MNVPPPPAPYAPLQVDAVQRPPSRVLAALLSFFAPGLGHVYAGRAARGAAWALANPVCGLLLIAGLERMRVGAAFVFLLLLFGFAPWLAAMIDAARVAARAPPLARRPGIAAMCLLGVLFFAVGRGEALLLRMLVVEAFTIPSGSMMPAILVGDHIFVDKTRRSPRRGDIVVFAHPEHTDQDFVSRVVGVAGDRIAIQGGRLLLNGVAPTSCLLGKGTMHSPDAAFDGEVFLEQLDGRPHLAFHDRSTAYAIDQGPWTVQSGEIFVMGDNRDNAYDSRMWWGGRGGGAPVANVRGTAFTVWMSVNGEGLDWDRLGLPLDGPHLPGELAHLQPELARCLRELKAD